MERRNALHQLKWIDSVAVVNKRPTGMACTFNKISKDTRNIQGDSSARGLGWVD